MDSSARTPEGLAVATGPAVVRPTLSFDRVAMRFPDGTEAIDDVSFEVAPGSS